MGAKQFQYNPSTLIVRFGEIQYENSARFPDPLSSDGFHSNPS